MDGAPRHLVPGTWSPAAGSRQVVAGLAGLAGVEDPGDGEHEGDHEGELGVGEAAVVEVDDGVEGPGSGANGPNPWCAAHMRFDAGGSGWMRVVARGLYSAHYAPSPR